MLFRLGARHRTWKIISLKPFFFGERLNFVEILQISDRKPFFIWRTLPRCVLGLWP